jgi:hypothetical protein
MGGEAMREVLDLIFEFLISILVIGGGGILMMLGKGDNTFLTSMMALVIYFWFQSRTNEKTVNNLLKQFPVQTGTTPLPGATTPINGIPQETTNPTNPTNVPR